MIFYEQLGLLQLLRIKATGAAAFYCRKSIAVRLFEKFGLNADVRKIDFGDVQVVTQVRRNAYEFAEKVVDRTEMSPWTASVSRTLKVNFDLIAKRFFHEELYEKYQFIELMLRYIREHPDDQHAISLERAFVGPYEEILREVPEVCIRNSSRWLGLPMLFLAPLLVRFLWKKDGIAGNKIFEGKIVCEIDGEELYAMFSDIFESISDKQFVIEKRRAGVFGAERLERLGITVLGLSKGDYDGLRLAAWPYMVHSLRHYAGIPFGGAPLINLFYSIIMGKGETIGGTGNAFFTFEHLVLAKLARNEFLKVDGNKSIFVSKNSGVTPRYHPEIFLNYDIVCATGRQDEETYQLRRSTASAYLRVDSYDRHRRSPVVAECPRIARLKAFKGGSAAITILLPGVCDATYNQEVKLLQLAQSIARQRDVKVFIRTKPVPSVPKYADFYAVHTSGSDALLLTMAEHTLADFLGITDLFITTISNSGFDIALRGGQVMFMDFIKDPDFSLAWSTVSEVVVAEEDALIVVRDWLDSAPQGPARERLATAMDRLTRFLGNQFPDFSAYQANLLSGLQRELHGRPALVTLQESPRILTTSH